MTKKKQKNKQKAQAPMPAADQQKEKEDELDMLEDIKRDEDLYISESDVSNISNFIRTTNKSFNSLGNTVVEKFSNRCSLAILHALLALFDLDSEDREDVIRRLNIIYIVWRLPDLEQQLRLKPTKTMNDVYSHPFATFLFYAEQLERHPVEATLARIIVTNNVNVVEKLTAPDFIQKAKNLNLHKVDREAFGKWTELNTDHWPEITEEMVSLSKAMRELGCERKEYEAGMAEAFYPLVHNPPTMLPPRMVPLKQEDPRIQKYLMEQDPHNKDAASVIYSQSVGIEMQDQLKEAFMELTQSVSDYQDAIDTGMTEKELEESRREIPLDGEMSESEDSDDGITDGDSDSDTDAETKLRQFADVNQLDEATMMQCISRILQGHTLTSKKQEYAIHFLRRMPLIHPTYLHLMGEGNKDENINLWCKTNPKFAAEFMCRHALTEKEDDTILFKRYLTIYESLQSALASYEFVVKISNEYRDQKRLTRQHQECVLNFVRNALNHVEEAKNTSTRSVRLVSMFIIKLLQGAIVTADDIASFVKPFCLKHTENRDCTVLYQMILDIQSGKGSVEEIKSTTTTTGTPSMMTTTTTTTSVNTNATSTTTTTTVIKQCGPAVIKQTSKKVVLSGPSIKMQFNPQKAQKLLGAATSALLRENPFKALMTADLTTTRAFIQLVEGEEELFSDSEMEENEEGFQGLVLLKKKEDEEEEEKKDPPPDDAPTTSSAEEEKKDPAPDVAPTTSSAEEEKKDPPPDDAPTTSSAEEEKKDPPPDDAPTTSSAAPAASTST